MSKQWFLEYFKLYRNLYDDNVLSKLTELKDCLVRTNSEGCKTMVFGNGGSAAISSHVTVDLTKNANIRSVNFNEADLITCFSNDFGYEYWMAKSIEFYGDNNDQVILISSSGKSKNVINAANVAKEKNYKLITFTGFNKNNPLKSLGDLNFWVDSRAYNVIEMTHHIWLLAVCDAIIGKSEYPAN